MPVKDIEISLSRDDLVTKLNGARGLCLAQVFIRRARDVIVPHPAADRVEHYPLKAVIVPNRPVAFAGLRECGHDRAGQMQVLLDESEVGRLGQIETALHLLFRWWAGPGLSTEADRVFLQYQIRFEPHAIQRKDRTRTWDRT